MKVFLFDKMTIVVKFSKIAFKEYSNLVDKVKIGKTSNKKPTFEQLLKSIDRIKEILKINPIYGNRIKLQNISKKSIKEFGTDKIFRVELVGY